MEKIQNEEISNEEIRKEYIGFRNSIGSGNKDSWKKCKVCGVPHFIPTEAGICLGCVKKKWK